MRSTFGSLIVIPLLGIALVASRFGFRPRYIVAASALGEILGLFLYCSYNRWRVGSVLSGLASGAVGYRGTEGPRSVPVGLLMFIAWGVMIAFCVLIGHGIYRRAKSGAPGSLRRTTPAGRGCARCSLRPHSVGHANVQPLALPQ